LPSPQRSYARLLFFACLLLRLHARKACVRLSAATHAHHSIFQIHQKIKSSFSSLKIRLDSWLRLALKTFCFTKRFYLTLPASAARHKMAKRFLKKTLCLRQESSLFRSVKMFLCRQISVAFCSVLRIQQFAPFDFWLQESLFSAI